MDTNTLLFLQGLTPIFAKADPALLMMFCVVVLLVGVLVFVVRHLSSLTKSVLRKLPKSS